MKNITIIGPAHPYRGGIATTNELLALNLQKAGYNVTIETFSMQYPGFLFPGKTQFSDSEAPEKLIINRSLNSINPFNWIRTGRKIKKSNADLIIIRYWLPFMAPCLGTIARVAKRNKHSKVITIADNIIPHEKRPGDYALTRFFTKSVDGFLSLSNIVLEEIKQFDQIKPKIFSPHPIFNSYGDIIDKQTALSNLKLPTDFKYILFFGLIRDYKGLDLLLKAIASDELKKLPVKLLIAGEFYSNREKYIDLIKELKLEDKIILRPEFIPDSEVASYFCASDIIVQPYKSATQSGVTQVGYHFERPMMVTNVGGLSEIIPHEKVGYVTKTEPAEISKYLLKYFSENKEVEFSKNAKEEKKRFSWEKLVEAIEGLYSKL